MSYLRLKSGHQDHDTSQCIGAGILPISMTPDNEVVVLLGKEGIHRNSMDSHTWCEFGGGRDHKEDIRVTAAREFEEESMALWADKIEMINLIMRNTDNRLIAEYNNGHYMQYVVYFNYDQTMVDQFRRVFRFNEQTVSKLGFTPEKAALEKIDVGWFYLNSIVDETLPSEYNIRDCCLNNLKRVGLLYIQRMYQLYNIQH